MMKRLLFFLMASYSFLTHGQIADPVYWQRVQLFNNTLFDYDTVRINRLHIEDQTGIDSLGKMFMYMGTTPATGETLVGDGAGFVLGTLTGGDIGGLTAEQILFGGSAGEIDQDPDFIYDDFLTAGNRLSILNSEPSGATATGLYLQSDVGPNYLNFAGDLVNEIQFVDDGASSTEWRISHDVVGEEFKIENVSSDETLDVDAYRIELHSSDHGQIDIGNGTQDLEFVADTIRFSGIDGSGEILGLDGSGDATLKSLPHMWAVTVNNSLCSSCTEYTTIMGSNQWNATEGRFRVYAPFDGTISEMRIWSNSPQPATGSAVYTLRKNGAATGLTVTIAASDPAGVYSDLVNTVTFVEGDYFTTEGLNNATSNASLIGGISFEVIADAQ